METVNQWHVSGDVCKDLEITVHFNYSKNIILRG